MGYNCFGSYDSFIFYLEMRKTLIFLFVNLLFLTNVNAFGIGPCGLGWNVGGIWSFTSGLGKEERACAKYARNVLGDEWVQGDAYCDCIERVYYKKKYDIDKDW